MRVKVGRNKESDLSMEDFSGVDMRLITFMRQCARALDIPIPRQGLESRLKDAILTEIHEMVDMMEEARADSKEHLDFVHKCAVLAGLPGDLAECDSWGGGALTKAIEALVEQNKMLLDAIEVAIDGLQPHKEGSTSITVWANKLHAALDEAHKLSVEKLYQSK